MYKRPWRSKCHRPRRSSPPGFFPVSRRASPPLIIGPIATSFSEPRHMRAGGQSSPSPHHLPSDCVFLLVIVELAIGVNPGGLGGRAPQILGRGAVGGSQGSCGRVAKYYYILSCTGSIFESGDF